MWCDVTLDGVDGTAAGHSGRGVADSHYNPFTVANDYGNYLKKMLGKCEDHGIEVLPPLRSWASCLRAATRSGESNPSVNHP